jgi:hypothetical protein
MAHTLTALVLAGQVILTQTETPAPAQPAGSDVSALKSLKLSGYVQPRFTVHEGSKPGVDDKLAPAVKDGFSVRRGRLKAIYTGAWSQYVLQVDATPRGLSLKDAEAHLFEPWTGKRLALVIGQTKWPFSYEVLQSSSEREFPERTRVVRAFAAGERDRGAKVVGKVGPAFFLAGVFDGNGADNKEFVAIDNDRHKDLVGRAGVDFDFITAAVSGWQGTTRQEGDDDLGIETAEFDRRRIGADVQLYLDFIPLGGTAIKGEWIQGETWTKDGIEQYGKKAMGYYGLVTQSFATWGALAVRYDWFDGDTDADSAVDSGDPEKPASNNPVGTLGVAFLYYVDESLKVTLAYEMPRAELAGDAVDPKDDLFTAQIQAKF